MQVHACQLTSVVITVMQEETEVIRALSQWDLITHNLAQIGGGTKNVPTREQKQGFQSSANAINILKVVLHLLMGLACSCGGYSPHPSPGATTGPKPNPKFHSHPNSVMAKLPLLTSLLMYFLNDPKPK